MNVIHGDCLEELKKLEDDSIDAVVCDPPYGLSNTKPQQVADVLKAWVTGDTVSVPAKRGGFMGADWDSFVPPPAVWEECMRVLKPGGHMAVFSGARTQDLMGLSIRLAGFEIRDTLGWIYGSGFPKSMDISKAIDKIGARPKETVVKLKAELRQVFDASGMTLSELNNRCGFEASGYLRTSSTWAELFPLHEKWAVMREVIGSDTDFSDEFKAAEREVIGKKQWTNSANHFVPGEDHTERVHTDITAPATSEAQRWDGWGTALKPAIEPIILARKPLAGTVANNVLAHGVGGLNIDACRVPSDEITGWGGAGAGGGTWNSENMRLGKDGDARPVQGRFPANVLLDEHAAKEMDEQSGPAGAHGESRGDGTRGMLGWQSDNRQTANVGAGGASRFFPVFKSEEETPETKGRFPANVLLDEHAAAEMDEQSGIVPSGGRTSARNSPKFSNGVYGQWDGAEEKTYAPDTGGASRYFPVFKYQAKAPKKERPVIEREDGSKIQHPTVKPVALMEWLVELITPPGGVVLDPFAGSGTTLQAALSKGFTPIGIEQDADYIELIKKRLGLLAQQ